MAHLIVEYLWDFSNKIVSDVTVSCIILFERNFMDEIIYIPCVLSFTCQNQYLFKRPTLNINMSCR